MSENQYREFLSTFGFTMNEIKKWFNDVVLIDGVDFPYSIDEIDSRIKFAEKTMHIFIEVEDNAGQFFEEEFWDKNAVDDLKNKNRRPRALL